MYSATPIHTFRGHQYSGGPFDVAKPLPRRNMAKKAPPLAIVETSANGVDNPVGNPVPMREGRNGGSLRSGGVNPGAGRPTDAWKAKMEKLSDRWAKAAAVERVVDDPAHKFWMKAGQFAAEQAHGKAPQPQEIRGGQVIEVIVRNESKQERAG